MYLNTFRNKIIQDINTSKLDIDMIYFVMKDIMLEITDLYNKEVITMAQSIESSDLTEEKIEPNKQEKEKEEIKENGTIK